MKEVDFRFGTSATRRNQYGLSVATPETDYFKTELNTDGSIRYVVDYQATAVGLSRWVIAKHPFRMGVKQTFKADRLTFTSTPLESGLRIVGSPLLRMSLNLTAEFERRSQDLQRDGRESLKVNRLKPAAALDVTVFGYLEDVDPSGQAHYVTEGRVLLSHRPTIAYRSGHELTGLTSWEDCVKPPYMEKIDDSASQKDTLRQTPRVGSADVVYQSGEQSNHHFSVGECQSICMLI